MKKLTLENKVDGLITSTKSLTEMMKLSFSRLEEKMDQKFEGVGQEFVKIYEKIDGLETTMNHRFDEVGSRQTSVERRVNLMEAK